MLDKVLLIFFFVDFSFSLNFFNICQSGIRQNGIHYLYCARKSLKQIPQFSLSNHLFDELILSENSIEHISENAFHGLRIKRLIILSNPLKSLDKNAFHELKNSLEELILEFDSSINQTIIPHALQTNLINLKSLTLINLKLQHLNIDFFHQMKKLEHLTLKSCHLQSIESKALVSIEKHLRTLSLDVNQLTEQLFFQLNQFDALEKLSLSHNHIEQIDFQWLNPHLESLDLSYNSIKTIDFFSHANLKFLNLQNNRLRNESFHGQLLSSLKEIHFDFNSIENFPEEFFLENNSLEILSIENNDFSLTNSYVFQYLNRLKKLNLARNNIQFIPKNLFRFTSLLEDLIMDRNPLFPFSNRTFFGIENSLINFSCQSCSLTSSSLIAFSSLKNLQSLQLQSNYLTQIIPEDLFSSMIHLRILDLQRNHLQTFPTHYPSSLQELQLRNNRLQTLILMNSTELNLFDISSNPLRCDCRIKSIYHWLLTHYQNELIRYVQWICHQPKEFEGKQLGSLVDNQLVCHEEIFLFDLSLTTSNSVLLKWTFSSSKLFIFENNFLLKTIDFNQTKRFYLIENLKFSTNYSFCLQAHHESHCRNLTTKNFHIEYFFLGIACGMIFILFLILLCLIQLYNQQKKSHSKHPSTRMICYCQQQNHFYHQLLTSRSQMII